MKALNSPRDVCPLRLVVATGWGFLSTLRPERVPAKADFYTYFFFILIAIHAIVNKTHTIFNVMLAPP